MSGLPIMTNTPKRLINIPIIFFLLGFSFKKIIEARSKNIGPAEAIIGAFMEGANFNPKKKNVILNVTPDNAKPKIFPQSCLWIIKLFREAIGNNKILAIKNLKYAKTKRGISCKLHLNIGDAAPQIILQKIKARIAACFLGNLKNHFTYLV